MELTLDPPFPDPLPHSQRRRYVMLGADHRVIEVPLWDWYMWLLTNPNMRVGESYVGTIRISTIFVAGVVPPWEAGMGKLFETLVVGGTFDQAMWHYGTWAEAEAGQKAAVELVRMALRTGLPLKSEPETP